MFIFRQLVIDEFVWKIFGCDVLLVEHYKVFDLDNEEWDSISLKKMKFSTDVSGIMKNQHCIDPLSPDTFDTIGKNKSLSRK